MTALLLAVSCASPDGTSKPDAAVADDKSRSSWNWRQVTRYGVMKWLMAALNAKTRGSAHSSSDFELLNAAILQEKGCRNATESSDEHKIVEEISPSAGILVETTPPQVHPKFADRFDELPRFPLQGCS
jgi:hypothetical protein